MSNAQTVEKENTVAEDFIWLGKKIGFFALYLIALAVCFQIYFSVRNSFDEVKQHIPTKITIEYSKKDGFTDLAEKLNIK